MDIDWNSAWQIGKDFWTIVKEAIVAFGWVKGTFTVFFWFAQFWIYREYRGRLRDRQKEIDRIAADNREYRDRFTGLLDQYFKPPHEITAPRAIKDTKPKKGKK